MTSPAILKAKTIKAILEAIDEDDAKDAEQALAMILNVIGTAEKK